MPHFVAASLFHLHTIHFKDVVRLPKVDICTASGFDTQIESKEKTIKKTYATTTKLKVHRQDETTDLNNEKKARPGVP